MLELSGSGTAAAPRTQASELGHHRGYLLRVARRQLHDAALSEDVVQDTLLDGWRALERFDGRSSLRTWLTTILQRRIADALRRLVRVRLHEAAAPAEQTEHRHADADLGDAWVDHRDPHRLLEARQALSRLDQGVRALPPRSARVLMLREVDGLSTEATARELGIEAARVRTILGRARDQLRRYVGRPAPPRAAVMPADVS